MTSLPRLLSPLPIGRLAPAFDQLMERGNMKRLADTDRNLAFTLTTCERDALWEAFRLYECLVRHLQDVKYIKFATDIGKIAETHVAAIQECGTKAQIRTVIEMTVAKWRFLEQQFKAFRQCEGGERASSGSTW